MKQLTKDDIKIDEDIAEDTIDGHDYWFNSKGTKFINYSKLEQVIEDYEKYKEGAIFLDREQPEAAKQLYKYMNDNNLSTMSRIDYMNWLFRHCFIEGLK